MTETVADDRTLDRVRKLLAQAEGTDNEHERDTFMAAANALMAKYGIEQAMLGAADKTRETPTNRRVDVSPPWAGVRANLIYFVAEAAGCKSVLLRTSGSQKVVKIYGFPSDIERAEVLYTSLLLQMASALTRVEIPHYESPRAYRRAWMLGFNSEVVYRIKAAERAAVKEHDQAQPAAGTASSAELVLADRRSAVTAVFEVDFPSVKTGRRSSISSSGGYSDGRVAGRRANIGGTGVGAGARRGIGGGR
ncbi:DUF2786 domain-containing protein [Herbidospora mongoliensis]|uniref:DUF2786 domain-containing protein n=1 Tax=Herbidospora mongoliensis TaxID=688067 RepID=UPI0008341B73|nr:DUF2786 domain-containing protein [Herbidospora mongoliensis]